MAIDATLKMTVTSLNIAAMFKEDPVKTQLEQSATIIGAVDTDLVPKMIEITEKTCGTCSQITTEVKEIIDDLEETLADSVPEWKTNPVFMAVKTAVDGLLSIVPNFCPSMSLEAPKLNDDVDCLTPEQDKDLKTSIMAIDATLKMTVTSLNIAAMFKEDPVKTQLEQSATIIGAVDTDLVSKMIDITEKTCGTCSQITTEVHEIVDDLENTLADSVPEWKTNPVFMAVKTAVDGLLSIVPNFCPSMSLEAPDLGSCLPNMFDCTGKGDSACCPGLKCCMNAYTSDHIFMACISPESGMSCPSGKFVLE